MTQIHRSAWLLVILSAALQILIFPLPNAYVLGWLALAPLLVALLRARPASELQLTVGIKLLPAKPWQGFLLGYACGVLWYAGTCYWIFDTMRNYGGLDASAAAGVTFLFCLYLGLYHGFFGLLISLLAGEESFSKRALLLSPAVWVAVELARTRITGFPWDLLGISQVDNIPLARIATATGVYGISFEIMLVNAAFAAAFLLRRSQRKPLLIAAIAAAVVLQSGRLLDLPPAAADHSARLVQQNLPVGDTTQWTKQVFSSTLNDLVQLSMNGLGTKRPDLIVWPESPAPFYSGDSFFRDAMSGLARQADAWVLTGTIGIRNANAGPQHTSQIFNSAALISPTGEWTARYDKVHLVPFGEYVPFRPVFSFAGGLTQAVGDFTAGEQRTPLDAGGTKLGVFICYESIFPDEVRQFANQGAQVLVNLSNDGWYGDSGAYAQHLKQSRMRAVENRRWLLLDTNTGVTASADPYGRIVTSIPRKERGVLDAPYQLLNQTTFYTRHGDWFAYLCAIISLAGLAMRLATSLQGKRHHG